MFFEKKIIDLRYLAERKPTDKFSGYVSGYVEAETYRNAETRVFKKRIRKRIHVGSVYP